MGLEDLLRRPSLAEVKTILEELESPDWVESPDVVRVVDTHLREVYGPAAETVPQFVKVLLARATIVIEDHPELKVH